MCAAAASVTAARIHADASAATPSACPMHLMRAQLNGHDSRQLGLEAALAAVR